MIQYFFNFWTVGQAMRRSSARRGKDVCVPEPHMNLPESCISTILSFTTPRDVSRLAAISKLFRSAADSDCVWNKFIPPQCYEILPRAVMHIQFNSKRELYFRLCHTILIDSGIKVYTNPCLSFHYRFIHSHSHSYSYSAATTTTEVLAGAIHRENRLHVICKNIRD